jgi:uncharacterized protein YndB with AHSA1/START domain
MARNEIEIDTSPVRVWAVLADGGRYAEWVIGAQEAAADESWPAEGAVLEHRSGLGPVGVEDETTVVETEPPRLLVLRARLGPFGEVEIRLELTAVDGGTKVTMDEAATSGALDILPGSDLALTARNALALRRLKRLAEG